MSKGSWLLVSDAKTLQVYSRSKFHNSSLNHTSQNNSFTHHSFHGNAWAQQMDLLISEWLHSSVGESTKPASLRSLVRIPLKTPKIFQVRIRDNCWDCPASFLQFRSKTVSKGRQNTWLRKWTEEQSCRSRVTRTQGCQTRAKLHAQHILLQLRNNTYVIALQNAKRR